MSLEETTRTTDHLERARGVLRQLSLREADDVRVRPVSGHNTSLLLPCRGADDSHFLLKFFVPPAEGKFYPAGVRIDDYARREGAFYRLLDSLDPDRTQLPAPKTILLDSLDPPRWILLEWIAGAVGPAEEILGMGHVFDLLRRLQGIPVDALVGRRHFPLNHWDVVSYLERVRLMYDPVLQVIGERRWRRMQDFFGEALRWTEARPPTLVHGDFTEQNVLVDADGAPFLIDFERIGIGNEDHDFAWLWIHSERPQTWKRALIGRYLAQRVGSDRVKAEWGIRAALVYLALRRLRFGALMYGSDDSGAARNMALLDAVLRGGEDLFPS
jgi:aminoglycoside phosphotransferase (APT) family kinase protein